MANNDYDYAEHYRTELIPPSDPVLVKIEADMQDKSRPDLLTPNIVWPEVGRTLYWLARATRAKKVLELGTGLGYATIWIARATVVQDGRVLTIERNPDIAEEARENITNADLLKWVEFRIGDARNMVPQLTERFNYVFMDVWKGHYVELLQPCVDVLEDSGLLIAARASWDLVREYMKQACIHPQLETIVLEGGGGRSPRHEGLIVSLKRWPPVDVTHF